MLQFFCKYSLDSFHPQSILQKPASGSSPFLIFSIFCEHVHHSFHIIKHLGWLHLLCNFYSHFGLRPKSSCHIDNKGTVSVSHKSHIPKCGMSVIFNPVFKADLQLSWELYLMNEPEHIVRRLFRIGQYIKTFFPLHSRQRRTHDISGKVTAAPSCHDAIVKCLFHQSTDIVFM